MKRWDRDMHKCDLNIIILGHDLHKNEVNSVFENLNPNPILNPTPNPTPYPNPNPNPKGYSK
jgi:hypothetical protein